DFVSGVSRPLDLPFDFAKIGRLALSACGTAYLAGLISKYWFERYARLPVDIDVASEFRYREMPLSGNDAISRDEEKRLVRELSEAPRFATQVLKLDEQIERISRDLSRYKDVLYLGRDTNFPLAMEGALKLKEISYIHAEGYAGGELKHGPIALIDENMPVIVIAPHDRIFEKTVSNMQEVAARGGKIILITDAKGAAQAGIKSMETIILPEVPEIIAPIIYALPIQMLAYFTAVFMGTDVDQPRNLAKSVTVE
ncbi:MAG: SIS domain-containing protein, partial [Mesorhizobium sp.]